MTKRIRPIVLSLGAAALVAQAFVLQACGGNNMGMAGSAGSTGSGTAGTTGGGGTTGDAGTTGSGGTTGTGGATGTAGTSGVFGEPACLGTVVKGGPCTPTDQQFCYKTCGPARTGVKTETCTTAGTYAEMSGCSFDPSKDYSCYKIPAAANTVCPAGVTPQGGSAATALCDVPDCTPCNSLQGAIGGQYLDSTGAPKTGWCTCQPPNGDGMRFWTCASDTAWPCPLGAGC